MENCRTAPCQEPKEGETIAQFGEAKLVRVEGRIRLRGGSMADRIEALEWLELFHPNEVACVERS